MRVVEGAADGKPGTGLDSAGTFEKGVGTGLDPVRGKTAGGRPVGEKTGGGGTPVDQLKGAASTEGVGAGADRPGTSPPFSIEQGFCKHNNWYNE